MDQVVNWLLDSDPAIRWQVMRDLTRDRNEVAAERSRVATEGWGARILDLQSNDGQWGGGAYSPKWISTTYTLLLLRHFEIDPYDERVQSAIELVRDQVRMSGPFFDYATEMCVTAMVLAVRSYFFSEVGEPPQIPHILGAQRDDGGWNCRVSSKRSSFHTTISALEALLEYENAVGGDSKVAEARHRAHEYLLKRRLMYSLSTGELINRRWLLLSFPTRWFYDVLRALDYLRASGLDPHPRMAEAVDVLRSKRRGDGTWPLQNPHRGQVHFDMDEGAGKPSRWNTLRALRVLRWFES
jgi:hypothetical protein